MAPLLQPTTEADGVSGADPSAPDTSGGGDHDDHLRTGHLGKTTVSHAVCFLHVFLRSYDDVEYVTFTLLELPWSDIFG